MLLPLHSWRAEYKCLQYTENQWYMFILKKNIVGGWTNPFEPKNGQIGSTEIFETTT